VQALLAPVAHGILYIIWYAAGRRGVGGEEGGRRWVSWPHLPVLSSHSARPFWQTAELNYMPLNTTTHMAAFALSLTSVVEGPETR